MDKRTVLLVLILLTLPITFAALPDPGHYASSVGADSMTGSTYSTIQDWLDTTQSAGKISGGTITSNADGTINVSAGTGLLKTTNSATGNIQFFDWSASNNIAVADEDESYVGIEYNSGSPQVFTETSKTSDGRTKFYLGKVFREGTNVNVLNAGQNAVETHRLVQQRFNQVDGEVVRASGLKVSEVETRKLSITSGVLFGGLTRYTTSAIDTNASDTFEYYYYNSTDWVYEDSTATTINNSHYNDITSGLVELTANRYGVHWVYMDVSGEPLVIYGQGDYTLSGAEEAQPPSSLPEHAADFSVLIAKIIVQKGGTNLYRIESAFDVSFTPSLVQEHDELAGLTDDDHTFYWETDGTDTATGNWDIGGYDLHNVGNVNSSEFFDDGTNIANIYIAQSDEGNLNVNSSVYWDSLNSPSDISAGDINDDNTYALVTGETFSGKVMLQYNDPIFEMYDNSGVNNDFEIHVDDDGVKFYQYGENISFYTYNTTPAISAQKRLVISEGDPAIIDVLASNWKFNSNNVALGENVEIQKVTSGGGTEYLTMGENALFDGVSIGIDDATDPNEGMYMGGGYITIWANDDGSSTGDLVSLNNETFSMGNRQFTNVEDITFNDNDDNKTLNIQSGDKICMDGSSCTAPIYYNGTHIVIG